MALKNLAMELNSNGVAFMEGRENAEIPTKQVLTIKNFDFLNGDSGEYAVFIVDEDISHFFFGGSVVTDKLKQLEEQMTEEDWIELNNIGLPALFEKRKAKKGKNIYTTCTFYPEDAV